MHPYQQPLSSNAHPYQLPIHSNNEDRTYQLDKLGNPEPSDAALERGSVYTVKSGDNMWNIWKSQAKSNGTSWSDFKAANEHIFTQPHNGDGIWPGDKVIIPRADRVNESVRSSAESESIRRAKGRDATAKKSAGDTYVNPATGQLVTAKDDSEKVLDGHIKGPSLDADLYNTHDTDATITDYRGKTVGEHGTVDAVGGHAYTTLVEGDGRIGHADSTGIEARARVKAGGELQAISAHSHDEETGATSDKVKVGAYIGTDVEGEVDGGLFGWFGVGGKASVGGGYGVAGESAVSNDGNGRHEISAFAKVGIGPSLGLGGRAWINTKKIGDDLTAAKDWTVNAATTAKDAVVDTASSIWGGISGAWNSISWGGNNHKY